MASKAYIVTTDITDNIIKNMADLQDFVDETNDMLEEMALAEGCAIADISDPISTVVKKWAVNYCCKLVAEAKAGTNNNDLQGGFDKYIVKLQEVYRPINTEYESKLNYYQFAGELADKRNHSAGGSLLIG